MFWCGLCVALSVPATVGAALTGIHFFLRWFYLHFMVRIFQERPLFVVPRGQPISGAEEVSLPTSDGLMLRGTYLKTTAPRRGVILFGLEFGSNRSSCLPYCDYLIEDGYDVFAFETRNQGDSDAQLGYEPLQWVTDYEVQDTEAAVAYLKSRPDADPRGIGFFGISKGAGAGLQVAARDSYLRCFVTDGVFACYTTVVPYMRQWYRIYNDHYAIQAVLPSWYYGLLGRVAMRWTELERHCRFVHLEGAIARLAPRPVLMIHGAGDTYIKPDMARDLYNFAGEPKELWIVEGAKHNQALLMAGDNYRLRVLEFFDRHLAGVGRLSAPALGCPTPDRNGEPTARDRAASCVEP